MNDKQLPKASSVRQASRFEQENAEALREAREEQRMLAEKRKKSGVPDRMFLPDLKKGTAVFICRRGSKSI